jgi:hypothetical protein
MFLEYTATVGTGSKLWGTGTMLKVSDIGDRLGLREAVLPLMEDLTRSGLVMNPGAEGMERGEGLYDLPPAHSANRSRPPRSARSYSPDSQLQASRNRISWVSVGLGTRDKSRPGAICL